MTRIEESAGALVPLLALTSVVALLSPPPLRADVARPMNLREMCQRAERIFSGTVVHATPGTVEAGGGHLPVVTYRVRVDESFKGDVEELKGMRFADVRIVAARNVKLAGASGLTTYFPGMPELAVGQKYLLLTARPNAIGMSPPIGRGQGVFRIRGAHGREEAMNQHGNRMLFTGMEPRAGLPAHRSLRASSGSAMEGPAPYAQLAELIRGLVREEGRGR